MPLTNLRVAAVAHFRDLRAAAVEVADDVAHVLLGRGHLALHDRFEHGRVGLLAACLSAMAPAILKAIS